MAFEGDLGKAVRAILYLSSLDLSEFLPLSSGMVCRGLISVMPI